MYENEHIFNVLNNVSKWQNFSWAPADMPVRLKKSYSQLHYLQILSAFLYNF